jgi:hypothetical protein
MQVRTQQEVNVRLEDKRIYFKYVCGGPSFATSELPTDRCHSL